MNKEILNNRRIAYFKAIKIIDSCITFNQVMVAMKYIHFYLKSFKDEETYIELLRHLSKKQKTINI
jgi:hypothetical protein